MSAKIPSRSKFLLIVAIAAILLSACDPTIEAEATIQAAADSVLATETPTPTRTAPPSPTATPFPPTATATLAPTETPFPPTITPTPATASWVDLSGDTVYCDTGEPVLDPEVDIIGIEAMRGTSTLTYTVQLSQTLVTDYSFAVALFNFTTETAVAYLWEIHAGDYRIGGVDPTTFQLLADPADPVQIEYDTANGAVQYTVPFSDTLMTDSFVAARSFHTPRMDEQKTCDATDALTLPANLFLPN